MTVAEKANAIPSGAWAVDPLHSTASFAVRHAAATFRGRFGQIDARLETVDGSPRLSGAVEVETIEIDDENLRPHLLSPEFFDVGRTPVVSFESSSIELDGEELTVRGQLEIKGARRELVARGHASGPLRGPSGERHLGLELRAEIDRTDFGLDWNLELPEGGTLLDDRVELLVNLELISEDG
jgi:polyisoprenoid-binding protein YceI